jgi:arylamine N-acetyltransferase
VNVWAQRYIDHIGIEAGEPGLEWLSRFCEAHLVKVPFENVTSLLRRLIAGDGPVAPIDPEKMLDAWIHGEGGGVCFDVAAMVNTLLPVLGFDAYPILGDIAFPGSHNAAVVRLDEGLHMVDLGCGAPFAEPIPLDRVSEQHRAGLAYRFRPDLASMTCEQDRMIEGEWKHFCHYDLRPASPERRQAGYQRHHEAGKTWVTNSIALVRFLENGEVLQVQNGRFVRHTDSGKHERPLTSRSDYIAAVRDEMGLPKLPIGLGLEAYEEITGREI